jgi:hypothetical protein
MRLCRITSPKLVAAAGIAFAILVLGACSGGGSSLPGPVPMPQQPVTPISGTLSVSLPQTGVTSASLPSVDGFTEKISFPANNAPTGTTLAVTVSSRAPGSMPALAPDMFVAQPFLYLTLSSNHTVTLDNYPGFTMKLAAGVTPDALPVKIGYYDPASGWKHVGDLTLVGSTATFTPTGSSHITLNANVTYYAITYTCGGPSPSPSPTSTSTTIPLVAGTPLPIPAFGGFDGTWVAAANNAPAGTTVTLTSSVKAPAGAPTPNAIVRPLFARPPTSKFFVTAKYSGSSKAAITNVTSGFTFDAFPKVSITLPTGFDTSGLTFKLETFDLATGAQLDTEIGTLSDTSPVVASFPGTDSPFVVNTAHQYLWELVTESTVAPSPSPSPSAAACSLGVTGSPNGNSTGNNVLNGTEASSASDAWADGYYTDSSNVNHSLLERWNGSTWSLVTAPVPAGNNDSLFAMAGTSSNDVWAVGTYFNSSEGYYDTLIDHYNGTSWSVIPSHGLGTVYSLLRAVSAHAANDAWAVGQYVDPSTGNTIPLSEHWNGKTWSVVTYPGIAEPYQALVGVADFGPDNAYSVNGWSVNQNGSGFLHPEAGFYNGSWTSTEMPAMGTIGSPVNAIAGINDHDIWGVGDWDDGGENFQTLAWHWNGTSWTIVPSPDNGGAEGSGDDTALFGATAVNTDDVWGVGTYYNGSAGAFQTYMMQWNGTAWTTVPSPNAGTGNNILNGAGKVPTTDNIWAVGYSMNGSLQQTLILGCAPAAKRDVRVR